MRKHIALLVVLFILDRTVKNIVWFSLQSVSGGFLHPLLNTNVAFSFAIPGLDAFALNAVLTVIVSLFCIFLMRLYRGRSADFVWWGLIMIGALSNLLDRYTLGGVLDYIDFGWFPVFNLSDSYITIGVLYLLGREMRSMLRSRVTR